MHHDRVSLAALVLFTALWQAAATDDPTAARGIATEQEDEFLIGTYLMNDLEDLQEWFRGQQQTYLPIAFPDTNAWLQLGTPRVLPFRATSFPPSFLQGLIGEKVNAVPVYQVRIIEDPDTRETVFFNCQNREIYALPPPPDYDPYAFLFEMRRNVQIGEDAKDLMDWLRRVYDPARIQISATLVDWEDLALYLYVDKRLAEERAVLDAGGGMPLLSFPRAPSTNDIRFVLLGLTNGGLGLRVEYPNSFTNRLELYTCTNLPPLTWDLAVTNLSTIGTNNLLVIDTNLGASVYFYAVGNADADNDRDALCDAREYLIHHTDPENADTDGDGMADGWELRFGYDPLDDGDGAQDTDNDGFTNAEEYRRQTHPQVFSGSVFAHFMPWWGDNVEYARSNLYEEHLDYFGLLSYGDSMHQNHWKDGYTTNGGPAIGEYSCRDRDVCEYHVLAAIASELDGFVVNWQGTNAGKAYMDEASRAIYAVLDEMCGKYGAAQVPFRLCSVNYDDLYYGDPTNFTVAVVSNDLRMIKEVFVQPYSNVYYHVWDGTNHTPFVSIFVNYGDQMQYRAGVVHTANLACGLDAHICWKNAATGSLAAADLLDSYYPWVQAQTWQTDGSDWGKEFLTNWFYRLLREDARTTNKLLTMGGAWAGFDDRHVNWYGTNAIPNGDPGNRWISRQNGAVFTGTWALAMAEETSKPPVRLMQVITWNDWNEGTSIEPASTNNGGYGYQYVDLLRPRAAAFRARLATNDAVGVRLAADIFRARKTWGADQAVVDNAVSNFLRGDYVAASNLLASVKTNLAQAICEDGFTKDFALAKPFWKVADAAAVEKVISDFELTSTAGFGMGHNSGSASNSFADGTYTGPLADLYGCRIDWVTQWALLTFYFTSFNASAYDTLEFDVAIGHAPTNELVVKLGDPAGRYWEYASAQATHLQQSGMVYRLRLQMATNVLSTPVGSPPPLSSVLTNLARIEIGMRYTTGTFSPARTMFLDNLKLTQAGVTNVVSTNAATLSRTTAATNTYMTIQARTTEAGAKSPLYRIDVTRYPILEVDLKGWNNTNSAENKLKMTIVDPNTSGRVEQVFDLPLGGGGLSTNWDYGAVVSDPFGWNWTGIQYMYLEVGIRNTNATVRPLMEVDAVRVRESKP